MLHVYPNTCLLSSKKFALFPLHALFFSRIQWSIWFAIILYKFYSIFIFFVCVVGISGIFSLVTNDWLDILLCYLLGTLIDIPFDPICKKFMEYVLDLQEIHISTIYRHPKITKKNALDFNMLKRGGGGVFIFFLWKILFTSSTLGTPFTNS